MVITVGDVVNATWSPPPVAWLNFSNCSAATAWLAAYGQLYEDEGSLWDGVSFDIVIGYLGSMIPRNWTRPTDANLLVWYHEKNYFRDNNALLMDMINFPLSNCSAQVCPKLQWEGDPDLTGVGAMLSYYMLAIFATLYFIVLFSDSLRDYSGAAIPAGRKEGHSILINCFRKSLNTFQDAVLLFAISVNVASITRWAAPIVHPNEPHAFYGLLNANFMSSFSIFPALALQSLSPGLRRKRIRLFLWFLVIIFALTVEVLYRYVYGAYFKYLWSQDTMVSEDIWLAKCDSHKMRSILASMTTAGHVFLALNCLRWLYHATATFRRNSLEKLKNGRVDYSGAGPWRRRWEASQPYLRLLDGAVCGLFMWTFLFLFTAYREAVKQKAGESDQDTEWTFGQVLSLVTWAPVALELITVYLYETKGRAKEKSTAAFRPLSLSNPSYHEKPDDEHVYMNSWHRVPLDDVERPRYSMDGRSSQSARAWPRLPITPRKSHFN
ncbi:hypothetical protein LA080_006841 [Diaporthe eres]|uniref:Uncharacterized protein n=1 Tax=Diaporthe vaccinii TaxID=105482 RepID=A0ABR4EX40_9PEZI|nr:hypothetical protein LA080_006841 [Diaporthe eres]